MTVSGSQLKVPNVVCLSLKPWVDIVAIWQHLQVWLVEQMLLTSMKNHLAFRLVTYQNTDFDDYIILRTITFLVIGNVF